MKVAIIVKRLNVRGGTQRQALEFGLKLQEQSHEVTFYTYKYDLSNTYEGFSQFPIVQTSRRGGACLPGYLSYFASLYREGVDAKKLADLIDKDTEVLNPHDQVSYKVAYFFKRRVRKIPSIWMMNDLPTKEFSFIREKENTPQYNLSIFKRIAYRLADSYDIWKYISVQDKIVVLDNRDKEWVKKYFNKDAAVVRSGIDLDKFDFAEHSKISQPFRLLAVGILLPHRRFEDAILAVDILKKRGIDVSLEIVGETSSNTAYYKKLLAEIESVNAQKNVIFAGKVSEEELLAAYSRSDAFIFPCHFQSWGLAVFEAMAVGLPVIVSKTAGASEILSHGENALLIEPKNPEDIADAIQKLCAEQYMLSKLSKNGRHFVENTLSWDNYAHDMLELMNSLT